MASTVDATWLGCGEWLCPLNRMWEIYMLCLLPLGAALLSLLFASILKCKLNSKPIGKSIDACKLDVLAAQVKSGSVAFLKEEYKFLSVFVILLALVLVVLYVVMPVSGKTEDAWDDGLRIAGVFVAGALLSAIAGWLGMMAAADGHVRATVACSKGTLNDGLQVAFATGSVMSFTVVGLGLLGISLMLWLLDINRSHQQTMQLMVGFALGGSAVALFARVAGGIYSKAAHVGTDLVGKVEAGIDKHNPRNPSVIADKVGNNVGDMAGMGADLFESYVGSIIAAAALGSHFPGNAALPHIALPLWLTTLGVLCAMIAYFAVSTSHQGNGLDVKLGSLLWALEKGVYLAVFLFVASSWGCTVILFNSDYGWKLYGCILLGLIAGAAIGKVTEYFTSFDFGPVISTKDRAYTGPATVAIQGMGVGMISTVPPTTILIGCILGCNALAGSYGVAIAAVGMVATLGITLATDAYGPVAVNAGGLAEMAGLAPEVRAKTDSLQVLGNTSVATSKGFACGSAVLTSFSLLLAYKAQVGTGLIFDCSDSVLLSGLLFGAMLPYLISALTMMSVVLAAADTLKEVRRQFLEVKNGKGRTLREALEVASVGLDIPEEEDVTPDSNKCVQISTWSSVREMIAPGVYMVLAPMLAGFWLGPRFLMGLLSGAIVSGAMLAMMMSNAGGAWINSKKLCEKLEINKTDQGTACEVGEAMGNPCKDTSGPALNILLKLMPMVSLTIAPFLKDEFGVGNEDWENWGWGMIPLGLGLVVTFLLACRRVLTWKDPLADLKAEEADVGLKVKEAEQWQEVSC